MGETQKPIEPLRGISVIALGLGLVIGGAVGLRLPEVPGGFVIVLGVLVIATQYRWLGRAMDKLGSRFPIL